MMDRHSAGMTVGKMLLSLGRRVKPLVPDKTRRWIDDRFFGAIFQVTRVTNDNYGDGPAAESGQSG